jgi:hypothetical protein
MAFDIIETTLSSAVVNAGTVTLSYPSGRTQLSYTGVNASGNGQVTVNDNERYDERASGVRVNFAYGASSITLTNNTGVTWPAGSTIRAQVNRADFTSGMNVDRPWQVPNVDAPATSLGTAPTVSGMTCEVVKNGPWFMLRYNLNAVVITVTDAAGSGSHGSLKLFDFNEGALMFLGCRQNYSAFTADGTGVTATVVFDIGVGTVAKSAAADGALGGATDDDIGGEIAVTLGTTSLPVSLISTAPAASDGTATARDLNLNWSGTAATVSANGTIAVTGTITVVGVLLDDD